MLSAIPVRIYEIPALIPEHALTGCTAVVIDVLRATSAMITALHHGCKEIIPVVSIEDAGVKRKEMDAFSPLLCGEREGKRIPGFDLGNSPLEYTKESVAGRTLIWTTTNGTKALHAATGADNILVAALLNVNATAQAALDTGKPVVIICAGTHGEPTLEDTVCAGLIVGQMQALDDRVEADEHCRQVIGIAGQWQSDIKSMFLASKHGKYLQSIGFAKDLEYCARINSIDKQVGFQDNRVK